MAASAACGREQSSSGPRLVFKEPEAHLGAMLDEGNAIHRFVFVNEGDRPLHILDIKASCRCTAATAKDAGIRPGESDFLEVDLHLKGLSGEQKAVVYVKSDDPVQPEQTLTFRVDVFPILEARPTILRMGEIAEGAGKSSTVEVVVRGEGRSLGDLESDNEHVAVRILNAETRDSELGPETVHVLEIAVSPDAPPGPLVGALTARTGDAEPSFRKVPIRAEIVGDIQPSENHVFIAENTPRTPFEHRLTLTSRKGADFSVVDIQPEFAENLELTFETAKSPAQPGTVEVLLSGVTPAQSGAIRGAVLIFTDQSPAPIRIPLHGHIVADPAE